MHFHQNKAPGDLYKQPASMKTQNPASENHLQDFIFDSVGMTGFEPATPSSRTKYATGLRYIPNNRLQKYYFFIDHKARQREDL